MRALHNQKMSIEAQIKANEEAIKANEDEIQENEENITAEQEAIEELQNEYDQKNKEADALNQQISDKISKMINDSQSNVDEQTQKIKDATEEANAKVEAGELEESEVAQYVANKVGDPSLATQNQDFSAISSLMTQVKSTCRHLPNMEPYSSRTHSIQG